LKPIIKFDAWVPSGIVKEHSLNTSRAEFLNQESDQKYAFLQELLDNIGIKDNNENNITKICYDLVLELIRATMLLEEYHATGGGAYEAEVYFP
jgi:hypothetical protein